MVPPQLSRAAVASAVYQVPRWALALLALLTCGSFYVFWDSLRFMFGQWQTDEFSHGFVIPLISLFLIWQRRKTLQSIEFKGSWVGLIWVLAGLAIEVIGQLSTLFVIQHIALLVVIWGLALSLTGWTGLRLLRVPLGILVFMVPLPILLLNTLSSELQLISSSVGVWLIRLAGVSVFLEGNVIDLGTYK